MSSDLSLFRTVLIVGVVALSLAACGRRGAPEAPPDPSAPKPQQGIHADGASDSALPSPVGTPKRNPKRGYTIPKDPFILDPLL